MARSFEASGFSASFAALALGSRQRLWPFAAEAAKEEGKDDEKGEESEAEEDEQKKEDRNEAKAEDEADESSSKEEKTEKARRVAADERELAVVDRKLDPEDDQEPEYEVEATSSGDVSAGVSDDGTFNLELMLKGICQQADASSKRMRKQHPEREAQLKRSRTDFRLAMANIKTAYNAKKAAIGATDVQTKSEAEGWADKAKAAARLLPFAAARKAARQAERLESLRKRNTQRDGGRKKMNELFEWRLRQERQGRRTWREAKREYRKWERSWRQASFRAQAAPLVVNVLRPHLMSGAGGVGLDFVAATRAGAIAIAGLQLPLQVNASTMQESLTAKLTLAMGPHTKKALAALEKKLWAGLDMAKNSMSATICRRVGNVPQVGGIFAPILEALINQIYMRAREGINLALVRFKAAAENAVAEGMVAAALQCAKPLAAAKNPLCNRTGEETSQIRVPPSKSLWDAGDAVAEQVVGSMQEEYKTLSDKAADSSDHAKQDILALVEEDRAKEAILEQEDSTDADGDGDEAEAKAEVKGEANEEAKAEERVEAKAEEEAEEKAEEKSEEKANAKTEEKAEKSVEAKTAEKAEQNT